MHTLMIRIFDTDGQRLTATQHMLQQKMQQHNLSAQLEPVACHLEISRQGLAGREPVLQVNDFIVSADQALTEQLLDDCCRRLARWQRAADSAVS